MTDAQKRLAEIRQSISQMTDDELYNEIGQSRNNRRSSEPSPTARKTKAKKESKTKVIKPTLNVDTMSPELAELLLKKLTSNG